MLLVKKEAQYNRNHKAYCLAYIRNNQEIKVRTLDKMREIVAKIGLFYVRLPNQIKLLLFNIFFFDLHATVSREM